MCCDISASCRCEFPKSQTSEAWSKLDMWEQSDVVLKFARQAAESACSKPLQSRPLPASTAEQLCVLLFDVHAAHYTTAMKLHQQVGCHGDCKWLANSVFRCYAAARRASTHARIAVAVSQTWHPEEAPTACVMLQLVVVSSTVSILACVKCPEACSCHSLFSKGVGQLRCNTCACRLQNTL
jgi:hypothetical protein